jgi:cytochrome c-L
MKKSLFILALALGFTTAGGLSTAFADFMMFNMVTGEPLNLDDALPEGRDTEAVRIFLENGENIYNENSATLAEAEDMFLTACSGCHGHLAEGKIGPGLNDDYWTYPDNTTDKGLFMTVFGGAQGQMGPQYGNLTLDEILLTMSWVRHLYTGPPDTATWLTPEQREAFKPYEAPHTASKD